MTTPNTTFDVDTVLVELQDSVRRQIIADKWYGKIDVFTPDDLPEDGKLQAVADISQRVNQAISAVNKGVCILVSVPMLKDFSPDAPDIFANLVPLLVRIIEMPAINRGANGTRKTCSIVGIHTLRRLRGQRFLGSTLVPLSAGLVPSDIAAGTLVWDITYRTSLDLASISITPQE